MGVEVTFDAPDGALVHDKLVKYLGYPVELFGVSSQPLPQTLPGEAPDGLPRVVELTPGNYLLWAVVRDYDYESGADALAGPDAGQDPSAIRSRPSRAVSGIPPLAAGERVNGPLPNVAVWRRDVDVSPHHYLTLFGFAVGAAANPPDEIAHVISSMVLRDYT